MFMTWKNVEHNKKIIRKARIVVNVCNLNKLIIFDIYSMSLQSEIIAMIISKNYIFVINVMTFFYHWRIKFKHWNRLIIISYQDQEIFNVALMKFINFIIYVQWQLDNKFRNFCEFCRVYIDDIIIVSTTLKKHMKHLDKIFNKLTKLHINLVLIKSYISFFNIKLLEQQVDNLNMSTSKAKLKTVREQTDFMKASKKRK